MTNKIRIFLGFLGLIALVSVFTFFNSFKNSPSAFLKPLTSSVLEAVDQDADKDGLANREESYWNTDFQNPDTDGDGFLDGEEVASGHDPLKPGPNDFLDSSKNITESLADLIVAGIYVQDLKPGVNNEKYDKAVSDLSLSVLDNFYKTQNSPSDISLVFVDDSTEKQKKYLEDMAMTIKENLLDFPQKISTDRPLDQQSDFFLNKSRQYKKSYDNLSKMPVPQNWGSVHRATLDILNRLAINYTFIGSNSTDPLKSVLAINEIQQNIEPEIKLLLGQVQSKIRQNNLSLESNVYHILNLIYK